MGLLVPADQVGTAFFKALIYGGASSGKTFTALKCATAIGKTAFIDASREVEPIKLHFKNPDGSPISICATKDPNVVIDALNEAVANKFDCFIVDTITAIYEDIQDAFLYKEWSKNSKIYKIYAADGTYPFGAWRFIKTPYKKMFYRLLSAPIHVFVLARGKIDWKVDAGGKPTDLGAKIDAETNTAYEPQIIIRMEYVKAENKRIAICERDRWLQIEGKKFFNPGREMFDPIIAKLGTIHLPLPEAAVDKFESVRRIPPNAQTLIMIRKRAKEGGVPDETVEEALADISQEAAVKLLNELSAGNYTAMMGAQSAPGGKDGASGH